jgi:hypothetical protein
MYSYIHMYLYIHCMYIYVYIYMYTNIHNLANGVLHLNLYILTSHRVYVSMTAFPRLLFYPPVIDSRSIFRARISTSVSEMPSGE